MKLRHSLGKWGACLLGGLFLGASISHALDMLSSEEQKKLGLSLVWITKPPVSVKLVQTFPVEWKLIGGLEVPHLNLHACPAEFGPHCTPQQGRLDGAILKGKGNSEYKEDFTFPETAKTGKYVMVGHVEVDGNNVMTDPIEVTVMPK